jgi:hypothetical protein
MYIYILPMSDYITRHTFSQTHSSALLSTGLSMPAAAHIERCFVQETEAWEQRCRCRRWCNGNRWIPARTWRRHQAEEHELIAEEAYRLDFLNGVLPAQDADAPGLGINNALPNPALYRPPLFYDNEAEPEVDDDDEPHLPPDPDIRSPPPSPPPGPDQPLHQEEDQPEVYVPDGIDGLPQPTLEHLKIAMSFIHSLREATFANSTLPETVKDTLLHPVHHVLDLEDRSTRLSLDIFIGCENGSRKAYEHQCAGIMRAHPEDKLLSWEQVQSRLNSQTGIHLQAHDMCEDSCVGFTGPWHACLTCPTCSKNRY